MLKKAGLFLYLLFFLITDINANPYSYELIDKEKGLSNTFIYTLIQDQNNYLWIGSIDGLYKYNGEEFIKYTTEDGLAENVITKSYIDQKGYLYFTHINGTVTQFDGDQFKQISISSKNTSQIIAFQQLEGKLFALSRNSGLFAVGDSLQYAVFPENRHIVCTGIAGVNNTLFIGHNEGLFKALITNEIKIEDSNFKFPVTGLYNKKYQGGIWIVTEENGIWELDEQENKKLVIPKNEINFIPEIFYEDFYGDLWIGSKSNGLKKFTFDDHLKRFKLKNTFNLTTTFPTSQISCIIQDHDNNYWIGSFDHGLIYLKHNPAEFYNTLNYPFNKIYTSASFEKENFLLGTDKGIFLLSYDAKSNKWKLDQEKWRNKLNFPCHSIYVDENNKIYAGTEKNGIYYFDQTKRWSPVRWNDQFKNIKIKQITTDNDDNLWITASNNGIFKIDLDNNEVINYSTYTGFIHNEVYDLCEGKNSMWVAMHANGLSVIDNQGKFHHLTKDGYLNARDVNAICNANDYMWVATDGSGIYKINEKHQIIDHFDQKLNSPYCSFVFSDKEYIYVGYNEGIDKINIKTDSVEHHFTDQKGMNPLKNAASINQNGTILVINNEGFYVINQLLKPLFSKQKKLHFTAFKLFDNKITIPQKAKTGNVIDLIDNYHFTYKDNYITLEFDNISFSHKDDILYSYRLNQNQWSSPSTQKFISLSSLSPGNYEVDIRSFNKKFINDSQTLSVKFNVASPFYQKFEFGAIMFVLIISSAVILHQNNTRKIRAQKIRLSNLVEERTKQLNEQKEKILEKNKELNTAKNEIITKNDQLQDLNDNLEELVKERTQKLKEALFELDTFLYHASHDLKGPVARLKGLALLSKLEKDQTNNLNNINLIEDESNRLNKILNKLDSIHTIFVKGLELEKINFKEFIQELIPDLKSQFNYKINIELEIADNLVLNSDDMIMKIILINLIENAFYFYRPELKDSSLIKISAAKKADHFIIKVYDNGIGIESSILDRVFEMYFRGSGHSKGNGLGLYLVKKGVDKLEGKIAVKSQVFSYTEFILYLPDITKQ